MILEYKERLGEGGFGEVWLAEDLELKRLCAVKFFKASPASQLAQASLHGIPLARVDHPCVVRVYATHEDEHPETHEEMYTIVMEYVPGTTLEGHSGQIDRVHALSIINDLVGGVRAIHDAGIVHGDLWERNVILTDSGAKIIDLFFERSLAGRSPASAEKALKNDLKDVAKLVSRVLEYVDGIAQSDLAAAYSQAWSATNLQDVQQIYAKLLEQKPIAQPAEESTFIATSSPSRVGWDGAAAALTAAEPEANAQHVSSGDSQRTPDENPGSLLLEQLTSVGLSDLLTPTVRSLILTSPREDLDRILKGARKYRESGDAQRRERRSLDLGSPLLAKLWMVTVVRKPFSSNTITYDGHRLAAQKIYFNERWSRESRFMVEQLTKQPEVGIALPSGRLFFAQKAPELTLHLMRGVVEATYRVCWDKAAVEGSIDETFFEDWWPWSGVKLPADIWTKTSEIVFWPAVRWRRFVDAERLEAAWNVAIAKVRLYTEKSKVERVWQVESLVHWYVRACLLLGMGVNLDETIRVHPSTQDWRHVSEMIRQLDEGPHGKPYLGVPMKEFLLRLPQFARLRDYLSEAAIGTLCPSG